MDLCEAAMRGDFEKVEELINEGNDIHVQAEFALRSASSNGYVKVVKLLVERGADIHILDNYSMNWACMNGHFEVVKFLYENGAVISPHNVVHTEKRGYLKISSFIKRKLLKEKLLTIN